MLSCDLDEYTQVKKRAVLDLLRGMRSQGLRNAKSCTPVQTSDMLHVMSLRQPFSADCLAGMDKPWLFAGHAKGSNVGQAAEVVEKGERYYLRGLSELSRMRLEAGAPVSRDITRREAEVSRHAPEENNPCCSQEDSSVCCVFAQWLVFVCGLKSNHW